MGKQLLDGYFMVALAFNAASFYSFWNGGQRFSGVDPAPASVLIILLWWTLSSTLRFPKTRSVMCTMAAFVFCAIAVTHVLNSDKYIAAPAYHDQNWRYAAFLNVCGALMLLLQSVEVGGKRITAITVVVLLLTGTLASLAQGGGGGKHQSQLCQDSPFFGAAISGGSFDPPAALPFQYKSEYVTMSDGVKLAADIYLPNEYSGEALPTVLLLTRYHRSELRSWLTKFTYLFGHPPNSASIFPMRSLHYLNLFVPDGYAYVSVDIRGTGASFGSRPIDLMDREVQDFGEIVAWTRGQSFCNGRIGTGGISYDGMAGALAAAQGGIDAVAILFTPGDVYEDIAYVGGIPTIGFVDLYGKFTHASELNIPVEDVDNELSASFKYIMSLALNGVAPVDGQQDLLPKAILGHVHNLDMTKAIRDPDVIGKDSTIVETSDGKKFAAMDLGITFDTYDGLIQHNVAVYSVAGYKDSGSVRAAARLHNYMLQNGSSSGSHSKLTIGPWTHGARACWTPDRGAGATKSQYPLFFDVKRFFDCHLKDQCSSSIKGGKVTGIDTEPRLNYYVLGQDKWANAPDEWPPVGLVDHDVPLNEFDLIENSNVVKTTDNDGTATGDGKTIIDFTVNFSTTSGIVSRWNLVQHLMKQAVVYDRRAEQTEHALIFDMLVPEPAATEGGLSIVGSPKLQLSLALCEDATDAAVFAYLEEQTVDDDDGKKIHYITETALRVSHRTSTNVTPSGQNKSGMTSRVGAFDAIYRSYLVKDMEPFNPNEFTIVDMIMEPITYTLRPGSKLRLVLTGSDVDNFYLDNIPNIAKKWQIDVAASKLVLPIQPTF